MSETLIFGSSSAAVTVTATPSGVAEESQCKNRLQEYAQKASMSLPVYTTVNEGSQHAPQFRSQVWVDGVCFTSPNTSSTRKMAEQNVAKYALIGLHEKVKNEGRLHVSEDTIFCKSIINEYAAKMNMGIPTYVTNQSMAMLPIFVSSLVLNGVTFTGDAGRTKKEAEQLVARSAILSILDSETSTTMSEIVKSKLKFYDAMKKAKDASTLHGQCTDLSTLQGGPVFAEATPCGVRGHCLISSTVQDLPVSAGVAPMEDINARKGEEIHESAVTGPAVSVPPASVPVSSLASCPVFAEVTPSAVQGQCVVSSTDQGVHVSSGVTPIEDINAPFSRKRKGKEVVESAVTGPAVSVPPSSVPESSLLLYPIQVAPRQCISAQPIAQPTHQSLHEFRKPDLHTSPADITPPITFVPPASQQAPVCSISGKKRARKNKNKNKKKRQAKSSSPTDDVPQNQVHAC